MNHIYILCFPSALFRTFSAERAFHPRPFPLVHGRGWKIPGPSDRQIEHPRKTSNPISLFSLLNLGLNHWGNDRKFTAPPQFLAQIR